MSERTTPHGSTATARSGCITLPGQLDRGRPEGVDGGVYAGVGGGVDGSFDPEVPLDAGLERLAREVAAADEGDAEARRL
jgi:hypothetical protein